MEKIFVKTRETKGLTDITDEINDVLKKNPIKSGLCHLFLTHTTAGLTTAYLNPEQELTLIDAFDTMVPKWKVLGHEPEHQYEHTHFIGHLPDHIIASFLGSSMEIPIENGKLLLGKFQRVVLVELNGPRKREIIINY